jgi:hypothetical protein
LRGSAGPGAASAAARHHQGRKFHPKTPSERLICPFS